MKPKSEHMPPGTLIDRASTLARRRRDRAYGSNIARTHWSPERETLTIRADNRPSRTRTIRRGVHWFNFSQFSALVSAYVWQYQTDNGLDGPHEKEPPKYRER